MINLNSSINSIGSINLPKVSTATTASTAATQKQNEDSTNKSGSASSSASSFGPAARVDISEQATRMQPARFTVDPSRKYDVLAEVKKSVAAREGKTIENDTAKTNDAAKTNGANGATDAKKNSPPARFVVEGKYDVLEEVKKSVAAREAAKNPTVTG